MTTSLATRRDRGLKQGSATATARLASVLLALLALSPAPALAWPSNNQWIPIVKGGLPIQDNETDANGGVNVVPNDGSSPAAYLANDGSYLFYRMRIDSTPLGGNGILAQFGWGLELDTNQNADDYEWLIMCDGISSPEVVTLQQNTVQGSLGDPSDRSEIQLASYPLVGNHRILSAPTNTNGDPDFFLDFRIPLDVFMSATGITESTMIRYFAGTSRSTNNLTDNGADLVAGSTLYAGIADYVTVLGTVPPGVAFHDGTVAFVTDLTGFTDRTVAAPGNTLYIRVEDDDLDPESVPGGQIYATLTTPAGDVEVVTLNATGVTGKYTGSIPTATGAVSTRSGTLQVAAGTVVTVTYYDAIASNLQQSVARTDTLRITSTEADVAVTKSVNTASTTPGQQVTFTVTAKNLGPLASTGLQVTDLLPVGLSYVSHLASGTTTYSSGTGLWNIGGLAVNADATLQLVASVNAGTNGQTLVNTAAITARGQADSVPANDTASASVLVGGTDLRVTNTVDKPQPTAGTNVTYTVAVRNLGPTATTGVQVTDALPAGLTYVSATPSQGSYTWGSGLWSVGALAVGATSTLSIVATVGAGTTGQTIVNTASLTATAQPDTNAANNSASASISVGYVDLAIAKSVSNSAPVPGGSIAYTVTVSNVSSANATGVVITDQLPSGLTFVSATVTVGTYSNATHLWTLGNLSAGGSAVLTLNAIVNAGTSGLTIVNEARITGRNQPDTNTLNDIASVLIAVGGTDVQLMKTVSNAAPAVNGTTIWTISVHNAGPATATSVAVTDQLPSGISGVSTGNNIQYTASQGTYTSTTGVWSVGTLAVGATATLSIPTTVNAGSGGLNITNVAMLTGLDQADVSSANDIASATIAVSGTDLAVTKTVNNAAPNSGQSVTYTIVARNNGPAAATGVVVNDLLPPEVSYVSHVAPGATTYVPSTGVWTIGALANGASQTLTITVLVRPEVTNVIIYNTARIDSPTQGDPVPSNDEATVAINVSAIDLRITKAASVAAPYEFSTLTYTVAVTNLGASTATGVEVQDALPAGLTYVSSTASHGAYASSFWTVGALNAGITATLTISVRVNVGTANSVITNQAAIVGLDQVDPVDENDLASVNITPTTAPPPTLTIVKSASVAIASPGQVITYTLVLQNTGVGPAANVVVNDLLTEFTAFSLNAWGAGAPFQFTDSSPASGLALGTPEYSRDGGATWSTVLNSAGGGAPAGYDGTPHFWRIPMSGLLEPGRGFTVAYKVIVR